jgi:hypothetical protein
MTRERYIGSLALGGAVAAVALLTGLHPAGADELADLEANQKLLQQQIDQLALGAAPVAAGSPSLAGSFARSFLIPGTDTSLLIGGYVKLDMTDWLNGGTPNGNASTSLIGASVVPSIPLNLHGTGLFAPAVFNAESRGNDVLQFTAKESRLRVETRTPTAWGEADTVFEMDFYGCQAGGGVGDCNGLNTTSNANVPRLRLAYGTLGGFIAGQAFVPVYDLDAHAELLDFCGDVGAFGYSRAPLVGYKWALPWGTSFGAYLVYPQTGVYTPAGSIDTTISGGTVGSSPIASNAAQVTGLDVNPTKSTFPDVNMVLRWQQPWGHLQISSVIQDLELEDGAFVSKQYIGYGGGIGANVKPGWFGWSKDNFGAEFFAGNGLDRYASNGTGTQPYAMNGLVSNYGGAAVDFYGTGDAGTTTAHNAAAVIATTVVQYGGQANYQHWWTPNLRSTISGGILAQAVPTSLLGPINGDTENIDKQMVTAHANLIWSPVAFINTGIEYIYGHRTTIWNTRGDENAIDVAFQVKF